MLTSNPFDDMIRSSSSSVDLMPKILVIQSKLPSSWSTNAPPVAIIINCQNISFLLNGAIVLCLTMLLWRECAVKLDISYLSAIVMKSASSCTVVLNVYKDLGTCRQGTAYTWLYQWWFKFFESRNSKVIWTPVSWHWSFKIRQRFINSKI